MSGQLTEMFTAAPAQDDEQPSDRVIRCLAIALNESPTRIRPLGSVINVDALNNLYRPDLSELVTVTFPYGELVVSTSSDGAVTVRSAIDR